MKPIPDHIKMGHMIKTYVNPFGPVKPVVVENRRQRESVTCSTIVRGNRKDPNSHSYTVSRLYYPKGQNTWTVVNGYGLSQERQDGFISFDGEHPFLNGVSFPPNLYNRTLSKLNEKVRGSLDLSVGLAQAGQTARMFNIIGAIRNHARRPVNFDWRHPIQDLANARLAWVYGWKPLASDLYAIADESLRFILNEIESFKVRCSDAVEREIDNRQFKFQYYGTPQGNGKRNGQYTCEIGVKLSTAGSNLDRWTSLNPLSIAWELMPYSFVVDWIIDVGSYLRDVETSLLYNNSFVNGYVSQGIFFDASWSCSSSRTDEAYGAENTYVVNAAASFQFRDFTRTKLSSYPAPRLPHFEADLGSGRLLNLAALLGSKLKK